ncbi:hypothetical protein RZS08_54685, partial [Arthrospira platensis SPKY1]|nr:hypothetical protein [Arthrospira platensis SPKY1]
MVNHGSDSAVLASPYHRLPNVTPALTLARVRPFQLRVRVADLEPPLAVGALEPAGGLAHGLGILA